MDVKPDKPVKHRCLNSGARVMLSVGEQIARQTRCPRCGRVLRVRVAEGANEATLPRHNEAP